MSPLPNTVRHLLYTLVACVLGIVSSAQPAEISGHVVDESSGEPLAGTGVRLIEDGSSRICNLDGEFRWRQLDGGSWTLVVTHIGYQRVERRLALAPDSAWHATIHLIAERIALQDLHVHAERDSLQASIPEERLSGRMLEHSLKNDLAGTLEKHQGVTVRRMGPAATRPILRGLSGERLPLLTGGQQTGDFSSSSADHAVALEAGNLTSIEVYKGPEALAFGDGGPGGVLNAKSPAYPMHRPQHPTGRLRLRGSSADNGRAGDLKVEAPLADMAIGLAGTLRSAEDLRTPTGRMSSSDLRAGTLTLGLSHIRPHWLYGGGLHTNRTEYGVPGGFSGAHFDGARIRVDLSAFEGRVRRLLASGATDDLRMRATLTDHREYESDGGLGLSLESRLVSLAGTHGFAPGNRLKAGGITLSDREVLRGGLTGTPDMRQSDGSGWLRAASEIGTFRASAAIRLHHRRFRLREEYTSTVLGRVRHRAFTTASASFRLNAPLRLGLRKPLLLELILDRGSRIPSMEELYSSGPHLAAWSYEIGNPDLDPERSWSTEFGLQAEAGAVHGSLSMYYTWYDNYIFPAWTGSNSARRADLLEYRYKDRDTIYRGLEGELSWDPRGPIRLEGRLSLVLAEHQDNGAPLPEIPPLGGRITLQHERKGLDLQAAWILNDRQDRVYTTEENGAREEPTAGWSRLDLSATYSRAIRGLWHEWLLSLDNVLDREYRDHLNRARAILPEAGRDFRLAWIVHY